MLRKQSKVFLTKDILRSVVDEQRRKGRTGQNQEQVEFSEVRKLDLGSRHILRIERLWEFTALTTLHLNNNCIEKMEGLSRLTHLKLLDLSFNNIIKIEGLESLSKLEELNLSDNKISLLENMESLEKLVTFNVANNNLSNLRQVLYLQTFKKLFALNFCGNPLSDEENYTLFLIAFFPSVKYIDYTYVNCDIKKHAAIKFSIELEKLSQEEVEREKKTKALKAQRDELQMHAEAFVESLNGSFLFEHMFKDDPLENKLQSVLEIAAQQKPFRQKMTELCVQLFGAGLVEQKRRQAEVDSFYTNHSLTTTETKQRESELLAEFEKYFKELKTESASTSEAAFKDELKQLQKHLLTLEFKLISQIEMMIKKLDVVLAEMVGTFSETAQDIFAQCRELEDKYHEKVQEIVTAMIDNVARDHGVEDLSDDVKMMFLDKGNVMGALTTAHENHLITIRDRENQLITRANAWKNRLIKKLQEEELQRNRMVLSHINTYVEHCDEEFHKLFNR